MAATPSPEPTVTVVPVQVGEESGLDRVLDISTQGVVVIGLAMVMVMVAAALIAWAVIKSAQLPPPTALITSLSLLTLFAVAGGIATNNDAAWTIAAAGVGALASSVSNIFQGGKYSPEQVEKAVAVVQEIERREDVDYAPPAAEGTRHPDDDPDYPSDSAPERLG